MSLYTETMLFDPVNGVLLFFQSHNGMNELKLVSIF